MRPSILLINPENFVEAIINEKRPVLLSCMSLDFNYQNQMDVLEEIAGLYATEVKLCLLVEYIEAFKTRLKIAGTPTFLMLIEGNEISRMLGVADFDLLKNFITQSLPS